MIINLPYVKPIDTLDLPSDFEEQVKASFAKFTEGVSKEYQFQDKLSYLDNLRRFYLREDNTCEAVKGLIADTVIYSLENDGDIDSRDFYSIEFMESCFELGFRPFKDKYEEYPNSDNDKTLEVIFKIIQIVVNYEGRYE